MKIPRNFDRWMFDYKEGNLSQSEMSYFENLMSENPQLNQDIEAWDNAYVKKETIAYPGMANLQRNRKFGIFYGWAATIAILLVVTTGSVFYISTKAENVYNLRDSRFGLFIQDEPNKTLLTKNSSEIIDSETIANAVNSQSIDISYYTPNSQSANQNNSSNSSLANKNLSQFISNDDYSKGEINSKIVNSEIDKIKSNNSDYTATYKNNPIYIPTIAKRTKKSKSNYGTIGYKLKKGLKRIEKMTGYPVGLTNLKDPDLLIPNNNLLDFNGSFTGGFGRPRVETRYRNQWLGSNSNLQSTQLNFDTYSQALRGGIGVVLNRNDFNNGGFTDNRISLFYSPKFALNRKVYFEPSIKMTLGVMTLNSSKIIPETEFEIERGRIIKTLPSTDLPSANNLWYKDYGLGFVLNADKFYIGFQADNLARHNQSVYNGTEKASIKYTAIIGMDYQSRNKKTTLSPFISYYNDTFANEFWGGVNMKYQSFTIGGAYSSNNDYSASLGMKFKTFKLIYQYDRTNSYIADKKIGSHTLGIRINTKRKKLK